MARHDETGEHGVPVDPDPEAHDILAAEEFPMPGEADAGPPHGVPVDPDHVDHEILAAEEFAIPAGGDTPAARLRDVVDQSGETAPHDVLAADQFGMPAPTEAHRAPPAAGRGPLVPALAAAGALLGLRALRRRRRR